MLIQSERTLRESFRTALVYFAAFFAIAFFDLHPIPSYATDPSFHEMHQILRTAHTIISEDRDASHSHDRDTALYDIAELQTISGDFPGAFATATSASPATTQDLLPPLVEAQARAGYGERARQALASCEKQFLDRCRKGLASGLASNGNFRDALGITATIEDAGIRGFTLAIIAEQQAIGSQIADALLTSQAIPDNSRYRTGMGFLDNEAEALSRIASIQAKQGHWVAGLLIASRIRDVFHQSLALGKIGQILGEQGDLQTAKDIATALPTLNQRACVLQELALIEARTGKWSSALKTAQLIAADGKCVTDDVVSTVSADSVVAQIAYIQAVEGDGLGAQQLLNTVQDKTILGTTMAKLAAIQAESDNLAGAEHILSGIPEEHADHALAAIAICLARRLQFERAISTAGRISNMHQRQLTRNKIVIVETSRGDARRAISFATNLTDSWERARLLAQIAIEQGKHAPISDALATLEHIPSVKQRRGFTHLVSITLAADIAQHQPSFHKPSWIDELLRPEDRAYADMGLAKGFMEKKLGHPLYRPVSLNDYE
ncbi:MAG: hypothetical protein IT389_02875 [Nitrospira sp.]|nr:hypothetical protein [Nitrospira sp.]